MVGDVDAALASFDAAHAKGSTLAPYLTVLLMFFTAPGQEAEATPEATCSKTGS